MLSPEQIAMQIKLELIKSLPEIIAESVKPVESIDGIKIVQVDGLGGGAQTLSNGDAAGAAKNGGNLAEQAVAAALQYRTQAPILDDLLNEVGLNSGSLSGLVRDTAVAATAPPKPKRVRRPKAPTNGPDVDPSA